MSGSCRLREPEGPQLGTGPGETHLPQGYHEMVPDVVEMGLTSRALFSEENRLDHEVLVEAQSRTELEGGRLGQAAGTLLAFPASLWPRLMHSQLFAFYRERA